MELYLRAVSAGNCLDHVPLCDPDHVWNEAADPVDSVALQDCNLTAFVHSRGMHRYALLLLRSLHSDERRQRLVEPILHMQRKHPAILADHLLDQPTHQVLPVQHIRRNSVLRSIRNRENAPIPAYARVKYAGRLQELV